MCILCILIPILIGLLAALLGYFLGRLVERKSEVYKKLRADLDACRKENECLPFDSALALSVYGKKVTENDLKIIEGIGPKIEELFHDAGIRTWKALGETSVEKCEQILNDAGDKYRMHKPATWPKQSEMAYLGKWKELKEWQDELDGGK